VVFLGLCAGLSSGFSVWNVFFALVFIPLVWGSRSLAFLIVAVLFGWFFRPSPLPLVTVLGGIYEGPAKVVTVPSSVRLGLAMVVEAKGKRYRLYLPKDSPINMGDEVFLRADIVPLTPTTIPQRLEVASLRPQRPVERVHEGFVGWKAAMLVRKSFVGYIEQYSQPVLVGLLNALSFNVTGDLGGGFFDALRRTGTVHIVSASGLHVTIVSAALAWLLFLTPFPRWLQLTALTLLLLLYAASAGFHPPMIRAVVMVLVGSFAYVFGREPDALSAMSLAGVGNLIWEPEAVGALGFQLSYLAVGFLLVFGSLGGVEAGLFKRILSHGGSLVRASVVATLATAPLLAFTFGEVPLISVISNLLVVPVLVFVVVGSLVSWALSGVLSLAIGVLKVVVEPLSGWIFAVVETTGSWSWSVLHFPPFSPYWLVFVYVCMAALYVPKKRPAQFSTFW